MDVSKELIKVASYLSNKMSSNYQVYKFHKEGDLHRNPLLMTLWKDYNLKSTDVEVYKDGVKANNLKAEKILKKLFNQKISKTTNYLSQLKMKPLDFGSKSWFGKIDGINCYIVWNTADRQLKTTSWWDITVGKYNKQTSNLKKVTTKEANEIIGEFLNKSKN